MLLYLLLERLRCLLIIRFFKPRLFLGSPIGNFLSLGSYNCDLSVNVIIVCLVCVASTNLVLLVS